MRRPTAPGASTMSDLLWYFQCPHTARFHQVKYAEFFAFYYLETRPLHVTMGRGHICIATVDTDQGLQQKVVRERSQGVIATRLQTVPVRSKELFYLRALLQTQSTSSFQDLRTVHGHCYPNYQEAATALGLFHDDHEAV